MTTNSVNIALHCRGSLFKLPASISIGSVDKELLVTGSLSTAERSIKELLIDNFKSPLPEDVISAIPFLAKPIDVTAFFIYEKQTQFVGLSVETTSLFFVRNNNGMFFLLDFDIAKMSGSNSPLAFISKIGGNLGIKQLNLMLGNNQSAQNLPDHINEKIKGSLSPHAAGYDAGKPFFSGIFDLTNGKPLTTALHLLTGIDTMTLQVGFKNSSISTLIVCPSINNKILESKNLIILVEGGANFHLNIQGTFIFKMIPKTSFTVASDISATRFTISATMIQKESIKLFGPFAIGNISLLIGYNGGLTFGMTCEMMIGDINMFGAFVINCTPKGVPEIQMLSGAVTNVTLASLISNFTGLKIDGTSWLESIGIYGFGLEVKEKPDVNCIKEVYPQLGKTCRNLIGDKAGVLGDDDFQIRKYAVGYTLTDNANMRHYIIGNDGTVSLQAQFYYSSTDLQMGNMRVQRGLFFCGVIKIWKIKISVLFFMQHGERIMAFTHINPIRLGFLELTASSFPSSADQKMPACPFTDALVKREEEKGAMLYFRAEKKLLDFYLDGRLKIAGIFEVDARIIYSKANVSIDVRYNLFGCFQVSIQVRASLSNFDKSLFSIIFIVDNTGLEKEFKAVSNALQQSIEKCRKTFDNASHVLQMAQSKVRGLQQEIDYLHNRINDCKNELRNAPWYKKIFVGIKVGVIIAGFEIAILAIRAAMLIAQGALKLAELAVKGIGKIAESVLLAAKALMDNILKLFYVRRFAFGLDASLASPSFGLEMELVILGKTIKIVKGNMGKKLSEQQVYSSAEQEINSNKDFQASLRDAEAGNIPMMSIDTVNEAFDLNTLTTKLDSGLEMLQNSNQLILDAQNSYYEEFGEEIDMRDEMNIEFSLALDEITQATNISKQMVSEDIMQELSTLDVDMANGANELLLSVDLMNKMNDGISKMTNMVRHPQMARRTENLNKDQDAEELGSMDNFYKKIDQAMYNYNMNHTWGDEYINIARELSIQGIIDDPMPMDRNDIYTPRL